MDEPRATSDTQSDDPLALQAAAVWPGDPPADAPLPHLRIGKYQIKREIDSGGMGVVYEAIQDQPRRSVALKLMRSGFSSRSTRTRFERESQTLARLRHPGIAQVYEAGTHRQGHDDVPYFAMEYIPGAKPITEYANAKKLGIRERLELFIQACDAVHHANQKGIIHRDIKPPNLLVDGRGQVKVIDFGVARVLDSDMAPATLQTDVNRIVGTLQYMSPEQCDNDPHDLDARSDVYALGVVLYELLCGRLPYDVSKAALSDATRIIREVSPVPPRTVRGEAAGDIETVILKALHKDRQRRYRSAEELAAEVRRLRASEPIQARRDSRTYLIRSHTRARARRHPILTILMVAAVALVGAELLEDFFINTLRSDAFIHRLMTSYLPTTRSGEIKHVAVVAITASTDLEALAAKHGVVGVHNSIPASQRLLHKRLMEKLAKSKARVVAFDMFFPRPSEFDPALAEGVNELARERIPVVLGVSTWHPPSVLQQLPAPVAERVVAGCVTAQLNLREPWGLDLIHRRPNSNPTPSLALATAAAYWFGQSRITFDFQPLTDVAYVRDEGTAPLSAAKRIELTFAQRRPTDAAAPSGIHKGDEVGQWFVAVPSAAALGAVTLSYADVLDASAAQLEGWFADKVVLVADQRPGRDGPHPLTGRRSLHGYTAQLAGIESLIHDEPIRTPRMIKVMGAFVWSRYIFDVSAAVIGAAIGMYLAFRTTRRLTGTLFAAVLLIVLSIAMYYYSRLLVSPFVSVIAVIVVAEAVASVVRIAWHKPSQN